ncbi:LysR family transcriptional regulator [Roseibium sp.]|uniref:LysR family transcriptional regulator n=1 Tax=Roseibium sp. TaxID=1936156 RepID=UPI003A97B718
MFRPPRHYLYLDAVARAGSIRKAAAKLGVASTALNRKILEIEEELGMPMFERLAKGVRLTTAGEVLIDAIRRNLSDIDAANAQIEQLRGLVRGNVSLAIAHSVANSLVPSAIAGYQVHHPRVNFQLLVGGTVDLVAALLRDETDLALVHDPAPTPDLNEIASIRQPLCAIVRHDHPLAGRSKLRLADCQPYPIALGNRTFGGRQLIDPVLKRTNLNLNVTLESNTVRSLMVYAKQTGAVCFQFQIGTLEDTATGELVAIPLIDPELTNGRLVLVNRTGRKLSLPAISFAETLKQYMARV